jgi:ABC-2 type transport system permease protein
VSPRLLLSVRLATRLIPIAALWVVLAGACLLMAGAGPGEAHARAAAWLTATLAYAAFWCALCAYVATWPGSSGVSVLRLAATWLLLVVVLPAALNGWTTWTIPMPDGVTLMQQARSAQLDAEQANSTLTEAVYAREPTLRPISAAPDTRRYAATTVLAQQLEVERRLAPLVQTFAEQAARQAAVIERLGLWSPATATTAALADAAGTGPERHRHFTAQADAFRAEWRAYFVPRMFRLERIAASDVAHFPRFQFTDEPPAAVVWRVLGRLPVLGTATLLLLWRAWARSGRLDRGVIEEESCPAGNRGGSIRRGNTAGGRDHHRSGDRCQPARRCRR